MNPWNYESMEIYGDLWRSMDAQDHHHRDFRIRLRGATTANSFVLVFMASVEGRCELLPSFRRLSKS